jgi:hypothetical protein
MEGTGGDRAFVSIEEAALALGTTQTKVLMMLRSKELVGCETDGAWRVDAASLDCARAHGIDRKEASGCASYCRSKCGCG